ncbi:electron transfer flavoprotein beta subunit [Kitasatospora gansuensis]|uniref:Electron transfer flavoprotein beta subunit n=1 Tax=Kitasatospora gansuensis TaxID=258050 RepID=A0A7W7S9E1_9ACTN|nr:mycofactocin-associated electron transfer flavoprotein beta subunit [Kitasatospora gansuensis]MBB4946097.1 electron transfer flavoprotein beta subunit [Kitasatospora gansuensis]
MAEQPLVVAALSPTDPLGGADAAALELVLRLTEALGGRSLAVTVGPAGGEEVLRQALACGVQQVLRIDCPGAVGSDAKARALATGLTAVPALLLCGDRSTGRGTGATPAFLAARLGTAQALGLTQLTLTDRQLTAVRRIDGRRREQLTVPQPAVCSVEPGSARLRRAALPALLTARTAEIPVATISLPEPRQRVRLSPARPYRPRPLVLPAPVGADPLARIRALTETDRPRTAARVITPAGPEAAVDELLGYLREHGYLTHLTREDDQC